MKKKRLVISLLRSVIIASIAALGFSGLRRSKCELASPAETFIP